MTQHKRLNNCRWQHTLSLHVHSCIYGQAIINWWTTFSNFQTWAESALRIRFVSTLFAFSSKYRANDWPVLDKIEWNMTIVRTEIVCYAWEQVKLAASAHWGLKKGKEALTVLKPLNSEGHKRRFGKRLLPFNRNSALLSGTIEIHGWLPNDHMIVTSDRDRPELYCLFSASTFDGKFTSTRYSQLQAILYL